MAVCECGHPEERHDPEENICLVNDCVCEEFLENFSGDEECEEIFPDEQEDFDDDSIIYEEPEEEID
jgi:hypothetical protein